jgi:hypothetical protein
MLLSSMEIMFGSRASSEHYHNPLTGIISRRPAACHVFQAPASKRLNSNGASCIGPCPYPSRGGRDCSYACRSTYYDVHIHAHNLLPPPEVPRLASAHPKSLHDSDPYPTVNNLRVYNRPPKPCLVPPPPTTPAYWDWTGLSDPGRQPSIQPSNIPPGPTNHSAIVGHALERQGPGTSIPL